MSVEEFGAEPAREQNDRKLSTSMLRGFKGRCPSCGLSKLFAGGLKVQNQCHVCEEELHHHRADDLPAYLNIFIVGHIVVAAAMIVMDMEIFGLWTLVLGTCALAIITAVALMRPLKGMIVGAQWAMRMHGFGGHED